MGSPGSIEPSDQGLQDKGFRTSSSTQDGSIPSAHATSWGYLLLDRHFDNAPCELPKSIKYLLGASPMKSASQISFATSAMLQQSGLARGAWRWRGRGHGTGQAGVVDALVLFGRSVGLSQATVELQTSFAMLR